MAKEIPRFTQIVVGADDALYALTESGAIWAYDYTGVTGDDETPSESGDERKWRKIT